MTKPVIRPPTAIPKIVTPTVPTVITTRLLKPEFTGEPVESWIHPEFSGLNLVTGFRGKGKTSYALKVDDSPNLIMIDCEDKGETLAEPMGIGAYFQPVTEVIEAYGFGYDLMAVYDRILQTIDAIPKGRFTTLVIDNADDLQRGAARFIENNASTSKKYGVRPDNALSGNWGGPWPGVKYLVKNLLHLANSKGIKVIVVTFQLKSAWENKQPAFNKFETTRVTIWHERSVLTLIMVDPMAENFPIPRALVMKESLSKMQKVVDPITGRGRIVQTRRIPPALPMAEPEYLYQYLSGGDYAYDHKNPRPGETVTALELSPFTPTFSNDQLFLLERAARAQAALGMVEQKEE